MDSRKLLLRVVKVIAFFFEKCRSQKVIFYSAKRLHYGLPRASCCQDQDHGAVHLRKYWRDVARQDLARNPAGKENPQTKVGWGFSTAWNKFTIPLCNVLPYKLCLCVSAHNGPHLHLPLPSAGEESRGAVSTPSFTLTLALSRRGRGK